MAASMKSFSQTSRFAVLSIDDDDSDDQKTPNQSNQNATKSTSAKKRNRKKKKADQSETAELRQLAFGGSGKLKKPQQHSGPASKPTVPGASGDVQEQWNEWRKIDEEFTNDQYETDLQQAILQSKLEHERQSEEIKTSVGTTANGNLKENKKKKKKKAAMSLEQFNQLDEECTEETEEVQMTKPKNTPRDTVSSDTGFFERVDEDTTKTILKEKIQEEYTKQYIVQNARTTHYEKEISKRDKEIVMLRATVAKLKDEALEAKQRNQQLCNILAQGEMKDKAGVLQSLDELTQVKNELMEEVNRLTAELEKEKSRSHGLKTELERYQNKASKHK